MLNLCIYWKKLTVYHCCRRSWAFAPPFAVIKVTWYPSFHHTLGYSESWTWSVACLSPTAVLVACCVGWIALFCVRCSVMCQSKPVESLCWRTLDSLMGCVVLEREAAVRPHRRVLASWRVYDKISHTGTDGIREYRREHCLLESQRG